MNLTPQADVAKCSGRDMHEVCEMRDRCRRYLAPSSGERQVWMLPVTVGWLCTEFVETEPDECHDRP